MMHQGLPPGVEHRKEPDLSAQMAGIRRDGPQRLGDRPEEEAIDDGLVLVGDGSDRRGDREDDVEVVDGEQVRSAGVDPRGACRDWWPHFGLDAGVRARVASIEPSPKRRLDLTLTGRRRQVQQAHVLDVGPLAVRPRRSSTAAGSSISASRQYVSLVGCLIRLKKLKSRAYEHDGGNKAPAHPHSPQVVKPHRLS